MHLKGYSSDLVLQLHVDLQETEWSKYLCLFSPPSWTDLENAGSYISHHTT